MLDSERLRRLEWLRFAVACSMVCVMIAQMVALFVFGFYSLWLWLAIVAAQWVVLQRMTMLIGRERKTVIDAWIADREAELR